MLSVNKAAFHFCFVCSSVIETLHNSIIEFSKFLFFYVKNFDVVFFVWNRNFDIRNLSRRWILNSYRHRLVIIIKSNWTVKISCVGLKALGPFCGSLHSWKFLNLLIDHFSIRNTIYFQWIEKSKSIIISHSLLSSTCDSIMVLINSKSIEHLISSIHNFCKIRVVNFLV